MYEEQMKAMDRTKVLGTVMGGGAYNECAQVRDTSAVEQALNRLSECIDIANAQVNELQRRLSPVLVPCPVEPAKYGSGNSTGSVCAIEERINDMVNRVASVTTQLRETREMLAI